MTARDRARAVALVAGASIVAGSLAGIMWGLTAPGQHLYVVDAARTLSLDLDSNNVFGAIAIFILLTALAGVLCGAVAWAWRSARGPAVGLALMVGGLLGAFLAAEIGGRVASARLGWPGEAGLADMVGQVAVRPPSIELWGDPGQFLWVALIGQALAAGLVYLCAAGVTAESDLGVADSAPGQPTRHRAEP